MWWVTGMPITQRPNQLQNLKMWKKNWETKSVNVFLGAKRENQPKWGKKT